jgi:hypothetical protein
MLSKPIVGQLMKIRFTQSRCNCSVLLPVRFDQCGRSGLQLRCKVKHKLTEIQNNCTSLFEFASLGIPSRKYAHKGINTFYTKTQTSEKNMVLFFSTKIRGRLIKIRSFSSMKQVDDYKI